MKRITVKDLYKYLKNFNDKDISLNMVGVLYTDIKIIKARCNYHNECAMIRIKGENIALGIDISAIYNATINEENTAISLYLDSDIKIIISLVE